MEREAQSILALKYFSSTSVTMRKTLEGLYGFRLRVVIDAISENNTATVPTPEPCIVADNGHEENVGSVSRIHLKGNVLPNLTDGVESRGSLVYVHRRGFVPVAS